MTLPEPKEPPWREEDFDRYLAELLDVCQQHRDITGLVLMGSTADRSRVDQWSDHDFAVVCPSGSQESLRSSLGWLPRADGLVAVAREPHDGFKAVYKDGHVIEFAVVDLDELATFKANDTEVAYDSGGVQPVMQSVLAKPLPGAHPDPHRDMTVFLTAILIGVGRSRRGELLSASGSIRGLALDHLLAVLAHLLPTDEAGRLDQLDPRRRFELAFPSLGSAISAALDAPVERCAESLMDLAHDQLFDRWHHYPSEAAAAVRQRLEWPTRA